VKFVLFVEGKTEYMGVGNFLKRWLDQRLPERVRITPVRFNGVSDYCGDIVKKARLHLSSARMGGVIAGIGLVDLQGLDSALKFPDGMVAMQQRREWAKRKLEKLVARANFRQHFAVHEIESWLLSDINIFPFGVRRSLAAASKAPEAVNFKNPPSRLLSRIYWAKLRYKYQKAVDGPDLFEQLDPDHACAKCPYLKALLEDMLALAKGATV
jgi:hypothetical protein